MRWAKAQGGAPPRFDLGSSGVPTPPAELLSLEGMEPGLERTGPDMPAEARRRVAAYWGRAEGEVMLTLGTSQALFLTAAVTLRPGTLCLVEDPAYEHLRGVARLFGAEVAIIPRRFEGGFGLPEGLAGRIRAMQPRLVLLSNPHNPSGRLLDRAALEPVAAACGEVGATLFVDEVYLPFLPEPSAHSAAGLPATVVGASLTKAFGLGALRFGWLVGSEAFVDAAIRYNDFCGVTFPEPSARIATAAFAALEVLQERADRLRGAGLDRVRRFIASRPELSWYEPDVGIVGFPRVEGLDVRALAEALRREHDTGIVPGSFFGAPNHFRLGFGAETGQLDEGLRRLGVALDAASAG